MNSVSVVGATAGELLDEGLLDEEPADGSFVSHSVSGSVSCFMGLLGEQHGEHVRMRLGVPVLEQRREHLRERLAEQLGDGVREWFRP